MIYLYHVLTLLTLPVYLIILAVRMYRNKEDISRIAERFGRASKNRPVGDVIWIHAASVGESSVALTLIDGWIKHHCNDASHFLITTTTLSSAHILSKRLPPNCIHQFLPIDNILFVKRFLNYWKPDLGIFIESDLWPCIVYEGAKMCRLLLFNARLSDKSFRRWQSAAIVFRKIIGNFHTVVVQSKVDYNKFKALGVKDVVNYGNIKLASKKLYVNVDELAELKNHLKNMKVVVAASTHSEDEAVIFDTIKPIKKLYPNCLFIIIMRHPERITEVVTELNNKSITYDIRSQVKLPSIEKEVYIVDTFGELGLFYSVSDISFVGGSFGCRGHNPIEPAQFGNVIIFGPDMSNFFSLAYEMINNSIAIQVHNLQELIDLISHIFNDASQDEMLKMKADAANFVNKHQNILENYLKMMKDNKLR